MDQEEDSMSVSLPSSPNQEAQNSHGRLNESMMDALTLAALYARFGDPPVVNRCHDEDHPFQLHHNEGDMLTLECCMLMPDGSHRTMGLPMTAEPFLHRCSAVEQRFNSLGQA
jgi:hypothetical protein